MIRASPRIPHPLVVNIGNFHTLAFQFRGRPVRPAVRASHGRADARAALGLAAGAGCRQHPPRGGVRGQGPRRAGVWIRALVPLDFVALVGPRRSPVGRYRPANLRRRPARRPDVDRLLRPAARLCRHRTGLARTDQRRAGREGRSQPVVELEAGNWLRSGFDISRITFHASRVTHHASRFTHHEVFMSETDTIKSILRMFNYGLFVATSASPERAARRDRQLGHAGVV